MRVSTCVCARAGVRFYVCVRASERARMRACVFTHHACAGRVRVCVRARARALVRECDRACIIASVCVVGDMCVRARARVHMCICVGCVDIDVCVCVCVRVRAPGIS